MGNVVIIEKLNNNLLKDQFLRAFSQLTVVNDFNKAKAVFIKPNLTFNRYKEGVTTRKEFVEALVASLREINITTKIYIGEGEGGSKCFSMTEAMRDMGFFEIAESYPNVYIVNLSQLPSRSVEIEANGKPYYIDLPEIFFDEIDFSITCPLPKVHCMTKITLSFKNQWGCLPDVMRLRNHYVFDEIIGQVCEKLKFRYAFLDGQYGLDDNGPMNGIPKKVDWFVASNSLGAFDMVVAEMMGFHWKKVRHLIEAKKRGFVPDRDQVQIVGDYKSLSNQFVLRRNFWNYPALVAFHSKWLTKLVYLSPFAKMIHDIMYTFRKKPLED